MSPLAPATPLTDISERELQAQVVQVARTLGFKVFHPFDSRRSAQGWPDLSLLRDRLILLELKTEKGKLSDYQREWLRALVQANVETYLVRPADLQAIAAVLSARRVHEGRLNTPRAREAEQQLLTELRKETGL